MQNEKSNSASGVSGEAQPLRGQRKVSLMIDEESPTHALPEKPLTLRELAEDWMEENISGEFDDELFGFLIAFAETLSLAPPDVKVSRTFGELPEAVSPMIEPHAWDNMNISEQRDWALEQLAQNFADDEVVQNHTNRVLDAYENDLKALAPPESPGPRCPKCGGKRLAIIMSNAEDKKLANPYVVCYDEGRPDHKIYFSHVADFAQFFAAPSTRTDNMESVKSCECGDGWKPGPRRMNAYMYCVCGGMLYAEQVRGKGSAFGMMAANLAPSTPQHAATNTAERIAGKIAKNRGYVNTWANFYDEPNSRAKLIALIESELSAAATPQSKSQDAEKLAGRIAEAVHLQFRPEDQIFYDSQKIKAAIIRVIAKTEGKESI